MSDGEYIFETREPVEKMIAELEERVRDVRAEADHARHTPGLEGPARNAAREAERLEAKVDDLREVAARIEAGYPFWVRAEFESALEAAANAWRWQSLSDVISDDLVYGQDDVDLQIPLDAQRNYRRALEASLFDRFEVCSMFETEGDNVVQATHYLFGVRDFAHQGATSFLVVQWRG